MNNLLTFISNFKFYSKPILLNPAKTAKRSAKRYAKNVFGKYFIRRNKD
jgi:hypothetical protein